MIVDYDILEKARYCLKCKNRPCNAGCPLHTNIPEFINEIINGNLEESYKILTENNIFSHVCSIICPQEQQCEGACVRGIKQTPTEIGNLEKYVNEWAEKNLVSEPVKINSEKNKKIAVIGSGPAGLECAFELRKQGYQVTVFEKENVIGGILTYGIPDFRLDKKLVEKIIEMITLMGVKFETKKELGNDLHIKDLLNEFDAVFLGIGAEVASTYDLGDFDGIYESDYFLHSYNDNNFIKELGDVAIIGCGNVAMDTSRAALRMGATSVNILYRRDEEHMPASKKELADAINDGVHPEFKTRVIKAEGMDGKIQRLKCIKTEVIDGKAIDIPNSEFYFNANTVVFAIGLKPNKKLLEEEGLEYNEKGLVVVDENGKTNIDRVYAGGDLQDSKATVCRALGSARVAASSIIEMLEGDVNV